MKKTLIPLIIFFALSFCGPAFAASHHDEALPLLAPVTDGLYRGAQPAEEGFRKLKEMGVRTVVDFRNEPGKIAWEKEIVEKLGMKFVSLPWSIWRSAGPEVLDEFFKVADDPQNRPLFYHCKHGRDRTGTMTVLSLMRYEKLTEKEAREKAFKISPNLRYRLFVNRKIKFFLKERPALFKKD